MKRIMRKYYTFILNHVCKIYFFTNLLVLITLLSLKAPFYAILLFGIFFIYSVIMLLAEIREKYLDVFSNLEENYENYKEAHRLRFNTYFTGDDLPSDYSERLEDLGKCIMHICFITLTYKRYKIFLGKKRMQRIEEIFESIADLNEKECPY